MAIIKLRDYQKEALKAIEDNFQSKTSRQLIVLPCGTGKTILMAAIAKTYNKKTLILAHRNELLIQTDKKIHLFWPKASVGICKAQQNDISKQIVVASVQTCCREKRLSQLIKQGFEVLLVDEAHHAAADTYKKIIKTLGFDTDKTKLLIGFTATPERNDKNKLGDVFDEVTFMRSISTMIKAGYLSPVFGRKILTTTSLDHVRTHMGDFMPGELSTVVNTPERNAFIVQKFLTYAASRKGVAFCVDVQHCQDLAAEFKAQGIKAAAIWGTMPGEARKRVLRNLKSGKIQVAVSCGVLTEGFDEPSINAVVMARPTKSRGLYIQCIGRGLRPSMGKSDCLVLDFADNGHNLNSVMSLGKTIPEAIEILEQKERQEQDFEKVNAPVVELCDKEFDLLGQTRFAWIDIGDEEYSLSDDERSEIIIRPQDDGYVSELYFNNKCEGEMREVLPLDYCQGVCEDYARMHLKMSYADTKGKWLYSAQRVDATFNQIKFLNKNKVNCNFLLYQNTLNNQLSA